MGNVYARDVNMELRNLHWYISVSSYSIPSSKQFQLLHSMYTQGYEAEVHLFSLLYRVYTPGYKADLIVHCYILRIRKDIKQIFFTLLYPE